MNQMDASLLTHIQVVSHQKVIQFYVQNSLRHNQPILNAQCVAMAARQTEIKGEN